MLHPANLRIAKEPRQASLACVAILRQSCSKGGKMTHFSIMVITGALSSVASWNMTTLVGEIS